MRLTGEGGKGKKDDVRLLKTGTMQCFGQQGEITALVDKPPRAQKVLVGGKQQGEIFELCGERPARLFRTAQEQLFVDAGRHELGERFVNGARRAPLEAGKLAFARCKKGSDRHHRALFGQKTRIRLRPRKEARKGGDLGEHGPSLHVEHGALGKQGELVFAENERPFPLLFERRDGGGKGGERIVERGRPDDVGHSLLLRTAAPPVSALL